MEQRKNSVVEVSISNFCNFSCDYCISGASHKKIPINPDGTVRIFKDLTFNSRGIVDLQRIRRLGLVIRGGKGNTFNFGIENPDGSIDREGDHVLEHDFIDYGKLLIFLRSYMKGWVVQLGGGEPLHNPKILEFLNDLVTTHRVILLTNLSLIKARKEILNIDPSKLFYRVGFHPEQYKIELYHENLSIIKNAGKDYVVNYMLHPRHLVNGMAKAYVDFLKDNDFNYEVTRFHGEWNGVTYPTKEISPIDLELLSGHSIENNYISDPNIPGTSYMSIYPDGNIYQCSKKVTCLGNIYKGFNPNNRQPMHACFPGKNTCQSVISQEYVLNDLWK